MHTASRKLLIVAPYQDEDALLETMADRLDASIEFLNYKTNLSVSRSVWRRHVIIFFMAFKAFKKIEDKDYILFGEQFVGLYYAAFTRLFFWKKILPRSMVLQLIYNKKSGVTGFIYHKIYQWLIGSPALSYLVCHASLEREYYCNAFGSVIGKKIFFVPFGRNVPATQEPIFLAPKKRYFFTGGTSNRDYATVVNAFKTTSAQLMIACHANDIKGLDIPENVTPLHDVFGKKFQKYIDNAYAVILPILKTDVSAGQLVLIDAMRSGKASIVTAGSCMDDYVDASSSIGVPKQDVEALRQAVKSLDSDPDRCHMLGQAALLQYESNFTRRAFADRLCNVITREKFVSDKTA